MHGSTQVFTKRINDPVFLAVQPNFNSLNQFNEYSVKTSKNQSVNASKLLLKLSSGVVSLPFSKFTHIRPSLLKNFNISIDDGFGILKSCSRLVDRETTDRVNLIDQLFQQLIELVGTPNKNHLIALIEAYRRSGKESIENYQSIFEQYSCPLDVKIFEELMYWACQNDKSMTNALKILDDMKVHAIKPTERIYAALILGHSKQGVDAFENVLNEMETMKIIPSSVTKVELINAYLRNGVKDKATEIFASSKDFSTDQLYEIIRGAVQNGHEKIIIQALESLPDSIRNAKLIAPELNNICIESLYLDNPQIDPYQLIIRHLPVPEFENEDSGRYGTFILKEMIAKDENPQRILKFCENLMISERNMHPIQYCCIIALMNKHPSSIDFLKALAAKEPLRPHYFWPLLRQAENDDAIFNVIRIANELNCRFDVQTYLDFILPRLPTLLDGQQMIRRLKDEGAPMNVLKTAFITFFVRNNRLEEALDLANRSQSTVDPFIVSSAFVQFVCGRHFNSKAAHTTAAILRKLQMKTSEANYDLAGQVGRIVSLWDAKNGFTALRWLMRSYEAADVKISRNAADLILQKVGKYRNIHDYLEPIVQGLVSDELFPEVHAKQKPKDSTVQVDDLELQLIELRAKGFPTHGKHLKQINCKFV